MFRDPLRESLRVPILTESKLSMRSTRDFDKDITVDVGHLSTCRESPDTKQMLPLLKPNIPHEDVKVNYLHLYWLVFCISYSL